MTLDWIPIKATRKITPKDRGNRGFLPSSKTSGGIIEYESCLERDFFLLCHHAPDVIRIQHQPITISYKDQQQKMRKYTPDAFIEFTGGKKGLFEIKYEEEVNEKSDFYQERWTAAQEWAEKQNIFFFVITEVKIRTPRWFNVWFTLGSSKARWMDDYLYELKQILSKEGEHYSEICFLLSETLGIEVNKAAQIVCYAIYHGLVFLDSFSTKQLSNTTIIRKKRIKTSPSFSPLWDEFGAKNQPKPTNFDDLEIKNFPIPEITFKIPLKYEEKVKTRLRIVKSWLKQPKQKRSTQWRINFCKKRNISEKTVYNWVNAFRSNGYEGLIPRHYSAGKSTSFSKKTLEIMEKSRKYYLKPLISLKNAHTDLEQLCNGQKIRTPTFSSFKKYIYDNTSASEFAKKRGKKFHKASFTPSLASFQGSFAPLQIIQMDNTGFDLFPVDEEDREQLSTPYMTAAMDCYTRMITGFTISYFPSSARTILDVLTQTILPKDYYHSIYETQQDWPIQGFPVLVLVDNGMDYRSHALKDFCMKYDVILEFAPIRTPRYKAFIEQWFNILRNALQNEEVPGFRPLLKKRLENPDLKPEIDAVLTLQEAEYWLHQWTLDDYHLTNPYEDYAPAPYLRWQDYHQCQTNIILPLPREPPKTQQEIDVLHLSTLERYERTLTYEGVVWHHLKYNNKKLASIYQQVGNQEVEVLLNPRDIRCIWIVNPTNIKPLKVELGSGWAQAVTKVHGNRPIHASAWRSDLKQLKRRLTTRISSFNYQREMSRIKREELLASAKKTTRTIRKEREKVKETKRKSVSKKITPKPAKINDVGDEEDETKEKKKKKIKIDYDNLPVLWTDDFYSGDL